MLLSEKESGIIVLYVISLKGFACTLPILSGYCTFLTSSFGSIMFLQKRLKKSCSIRRCTARCRKGTCPEKTYRLPWDRRRQDDTSSFFLYTNQHMKPSFSVHVTWTRRKDGSMHDDKQMPPFNGYEEMAEFWGTHSLADYW